MNNRLIYSFGIFFFLFLTKNLTGQEVIPLMETEHHYGKTETEQKWFIQIKETLANMDFRGYLLEDDSLDQYLAEIERRVRPEGLDTFNIQGSILKSPAINATMFANGQFQVNTGTLAALENEAQLAYFICHEMAHFIDRHALRKYYHADKYDKKRKQIKNKTIMEKLSEYSQQIESIADSIGLELYLTAGYKPSEAVRALQKLPPPNAPFKVSKFVKLLLRIHPALPTHPLSKDRIKNVKRIIAGKNIKDEGIVNAERYQRLVKELPRLNLKLMRDSRIPALNVIPKLDTLQLSISDTTSLYYREVTLAKGELYLEALSDPVSTGMVYLMEERRKKDLPEIAIYTPKATTKAFEKYKPILEDKAIEIMTPMLEDLELGYRAHRALGLVYHQRKDSEKTKLHLEKYLNSGQTIKDKRYISSILRKLK